jgi:hypothetical protein
MSVINPNATRMKAEEQRERILACLRDTRCAMTPLQVRDRLYETRNGSITEKTVAQQLGILLKDGKVEHPGPGNTSQFQWRRP